MSGPCELMLRIECDHCPDFYRVIPSFYPPHLGWLSRHLRDNPGHKIAVYLTQHPNEELTR